MLFKCCKCKELLPRESFGGLKKRADYCRPCALDTSRNYYKDNKAKCNATNKRVAAQRYKINRSNLRGYLDRHPCVDCGESDHVVLEFDHIDPTTKKAKIANIIGSWNWNTVMTEIDKCEVRCANCHRRRTASQFGWYKGGDANDTN